MGFRKNLQKIFAGQKRAMRGWGAGRASERGGECENRTWRSGAGRASGRRASERGGECESARTRGLRKITSAVRIKTARGAARDYQARLRAKTKARYPCGYRAFRLYRQVSPALSGLLCFFGIGGIAFRLC